LKIFTELSAYFKASFNDIEKKINEEVEKINGYLSQSEQNIKEIIIKFKEKIKNKFNLSDLIFEKKINYIETEEDLKIDVSLKNIAYSNNDSQNKNINDKKEEVKLNTNNEIKPEEPIRFDKTFGKKEIAVEVNTNTNNVEKKEIKISYKNVSPNIGYSVNELKKRIFRAKPFPTFT